MNHGDTETRSTIVKIANAQHFNHLQQAPTDLVSVEP